MSFSNSEPGMIPCFNHVLILKRAMSFSNDKKATCFRTAQCRQYSTGTSHLLPSNELNIKQNKTLSLLFCWYDIYSLTHIRFSFFFLIWILQPIPENFICDKPRWAKIRAPRENTWSPSYHMKVATKNKASQIRLKKHPMALVGFESRSPVKSPMLYHWDKESYSLTQLSEIGYKPISYV